MQRGGFGWSGNYGIEMNPPGTIGSNLPHGTGTGSSKIFDSRRGMSYLSNRSESLCNSAAISENPERDNIFKISGHKNF